MRCYLCDAKATLYTRDKVPVCNSCFKSLTQEQEVEEILAEWERDVRTQRNEAPKWQEVARAEKLEVTHEPAGQEVDGPPLAAINLGTAGHLRLEQAFGIVDLGGNQDRVTQDRVVDGRCDRGDRQDLAGELALRIRAGLEHDILAFKGGGAFRIGISPPVTQRCPDIRRGPKALNAPVDFGIQRREAIFDIDAIIE